MTDQPPRPVGCAFCGQRATGTVDHGDGVIHAACGFCMSRYLEDLELPPLCPELDPELDPSTVAAQAGSHAPGGPSQRSALHLESGDGSSTEGAS